MITCSHWTALCATLFMLLSLAPLVFTHKYILYVCRSNPLALVAAQLLYSIYLDPGSRLYPYIMASYDFCIIVYCM